MPSPVLHSAPGWADGLAAGWPKEQARAAECYAESERLVIAASEAADAIERGVVKQGLLLRLR